ncbi:MAG: tRNA 2-thiouridine(34) synthase MnmA [Phycisphaeraceae bacterium]|nr:MAG: tRNA 2-thiouridine(34) synthase MnmA [Phycisphaeraceae bacterium]
MSGGVDSSVAAALLLREGYEVVGCFMRLGSPGESLDELTPGDECPAPAGGKPVKIGHQGCCSINDAADARRVAAMLGVPFYVCNFKKDFGRIIDYFADEYAAGRTPNPCVRCNDWLKFGKLREYAAQIGADSVASGHYARVEPDSGGEPRLRRGIDASKDQSYVLFGVPREHLARMRLPIGGMEKPRVRELAREMGLPVFDKPDSQEICFVPDNDYAGLVERVRPGSAREGAIVDARGVEVGRHGGQHRFTIGQRRGLSLSLGHPVYVVGKDPATNTVTVGARGLLLASGCSAGEANWLLDPPEGWFRVMAKYRYNTPAVAARCRRLGDGEPGPSGRSGRFEVAFDEPQAAVAPGQAIVLYDPADGATVLGGGWIDGVSGVAG